ncbi:MAG TPA: hypothetical protein VIF09_12805 [Polyangiaceae bacterium]|jgi:hypothetical protein
MARTPFALLLAPFPLVLVAACGGGGGVSTPPQTPAEEQPTEAEIAQAQKPCGVTDKEHKHDLSSGQASESFTPCAKGGARDYSALVKIETLDEGVHIIIDATDEDVTLLGPDVKTKDAVIVYPKGKGSVAVEVPLMKTRTGYHGDKVFLWDELGKLNDEGTKIDVAIYDHDKKSNDTEEMHVAVGVSTGKSCEKAQDENPQTISMGKADTRPDLSKDELGRPISSSNAAVACGLSDSAHASICVLVRGGKPLGVTVNVTPSSNRVAACMDRRMRHLAFPVSDKPDTVTYNY